MNKLLITGSHGKIGRYLCDFLKHFGYQIETFDLLDGQDIRDQEILEKKMEGCSGIIHLAAISRVAPAQKDPKTCYEVNCHGTINVVKKALKRKRQPWILFMSSRDVYGNTPPIGVFENDPVYPINVYGYSKLSAEREMMEFFSNGGRGLIIRLTNVYGINNDFPDRVIPNFTQRALKGKPLKVYGENQLLDFIHINDVCHGMLHAIDGLNNVQNYSFQQSVFNLCSGRSVSLGGLASMIVRFTNTGSEIKELDAHENRVDRFLGNNTRFRSTFSWEPKIDFSVGLEKYIEEQNSFKELCYA